jgi:hypothetical protein
MKNSTQVYQQQFAQTFAKLMGYTFTANHPVAPLVEGLLRK